MDVSVEVVTIAVVYMHLGKYCSIIPQADGSVSSWIG